MCGHSYKKQPCCEVEERARKNTTIWLIILLTVVAALLIAISVVKSRAAEAEADELLNSGSSVARVSFSDEILTLKYADGSKESFHKEDLPRELWKKKMTNDGHLVVVKKGDFIDSGEQIYLLSSKEWQCAFFALSFMQ